MLFREKSFISFMKAEIKQNPNLFQKLEEHNHLKPYLTYVYFE
jgi:hypothetical protein